MTQSSKFSVKCNCGHLGELVMRENDAPFSTQWESYKLSGFNGGTSCGIDPGFMSFKEVFAELSPSCPKCGKQINESNLKE